MLPKVENQSIPNWKPEKPEGYDGAKAFLVDHVTRYNDESLIITNIELVGMD